MMVFKKMLQFLGFGLSKEKNNKYKASTAKVEIKEGVAIKKISVIPFLVKIEIFVVKLFIKFFKFFIKESNYLYYEIYINSLTQELDLRNEARNIKFFTENHKGLGFDVAKIPKLYDFDKNQLKTEYISGELLVNYQENEFSEKYYQTFLKTMIYDVFFLRYYHADVHAGNIILKNKDVYFIDYANCSQISEKSLIIFVTIYKMVIENNLNGIYHLFVNNNLMRKEVDELVFTSDVSNVIFNSFRLENRLNKEILGKGILGLVNKYKFNMPNDIILITKTAYNIVCTLEKINSKLNVLEVMKSLFRDFEIEEKLAKMIFKQKITIMLSKLI